jgi:hypothetical protein
MDNRLLVARQSAFDADAVAYISNVETADGAYLESSVKTSINNLIVGLKNDGLWESLEASCLLCGPRTLAGALVPLRGVAPTAVAFTDGDYSRSAGLTGDGATTHLNSNRANNADPQDDKHIAVYATTLQTNSGYYLSSGYNATSASILRGSGTQLVAFLNGAFQAVSNAHTAAGFLGSSRDNGATQVIRGSGLQSSVSSVSAPASSSASIKVFGEVYSDATIAFYSIGTSLDLAKLDTHISSYVTAIGAAI